MGMPLTGFCPAAHERVVVGAGQKAHVGMEMRARVAH